MEIIDCETINIVNTLEKEEYDSISPDIMSIIDSVIKYNVSNYGPIDKEDDENNLGFTRNSNLNLSEFIELVKDNYEYGFDQFIILEGVIKIDDKEYKVILIVLDTYFYKHGELHIIDNNNKKIHVCNYEEENKKNACVFIERIPGCDINFTIKDLRELYSFMH